VGGKAVVVGNNVVGGNAVVVGNSVVGGKAVVVGNNVVGGKAVEVGNKVVGGNAVTVVVPGNVVVVPGDGGDWAKPWRMRIAPANGAATAIRVTAITRGRRLGVAGTGFLCSSATIAPVSRLSLAQ
jgi:hypothetical protein